MNHETFYISKSFKSHVNRYVIDGETHSDLVSYGKRVAAYNHTENYISIYWCDSATTRKHINEFLVYYGFDKMTKSQMEAFKE